VERRRTIQGIVAEIAASGDSVSAAAGRHGLAPQQLFGWRQELQASQTALFFRAEDLDFVRAVLDGHGLLRLSDVNAKQRSVTAVLRALKDGA
jgi:transposase-like protein